MMSLRKNYYIYAHIAIIAIISLVIWHINAIHFTDYYNHIARLYISYFISDDHALRSMYVLEPFHLAPYLAMDLVFKLLSYFFDIYTAAIGFVVLVFVITTSGLVCLNYVIHNRITPYSFFVYPLFFSSILSWGFINYILGVGVLFWLLAWWLKAEKKGYLFFTCYTMAMTMLFFIHLFAFAMCGIIMGVIILTDHLSKQKLHVKALFFSGLPHGLCFVPGVLLYIMAKPPNFDTHAVLSYGTIDEKFHALLSPFLFGNYQLASLLFCAAVLVMKFSSYIGARYRMLLWLLLAIAVAMPFRLWVVDFADVRVPYVLVMLCVVMATYRISVKGSRRYIGLAAIFMLCVISMVHLWSVKSIIQECGRWSDEFRGITSHVMPPHSRVMVVRNGEALQKNHCGVIFAQDYLSTLLIIDRGAFIAELFTGLPYVEPVKEYEPFDVRIGRVSDIQQLISQDASYTQATQKQKWPRDGWQDFYDYLIYMHYGDEQYDDQIAYEQLHHDHFFSIYALKK